MLITLGIDPGLRGGLAALDESGAVLLAERMPTRTVGRAVELTDGDAVRRLIAALRGQAPSLYVRVFVERCSARPTDGRGGAFLFGAQYGVVLDAVAGLGHVELVTPAQWRQALGVEAVAKGLPRAEARAAAKAGALAYVRARWPGLALTPGRCSKPHNGIVDALCLAAFGLAWRGVEKPARKRKARRTKGAAA